MKINIDSLKLTDAPYSGALAGAFLFDDANELQQLLLELQYARPGSYLVSGYRGSGKTSFINRVSEAITGYMVVELNISKSTEYPVVVKRIIRQLYLKYIAYCAANTLTDASFEAEFKLLYDRTFHDIVRSQADSSKKEKKGETKFEYNFQKLIPYLLVLLSATGITLDLSAKWVQYVFLICSLALACVTTFTRTITTTATDSNTDESSRKSLYDDEIAEHHLFSVLKQLKDAEIKLLIVFDELDKLQDNDKIKDVINDLKPLLLSGYASFMLVAGQSLYYELEKSTYLDDPVISTLFSKTIHVSFLKNATLKKFCLGLISDDTARSDRLVNDYFDALILQSSRIPRKLVNLIRAVIHWDGAQAIVLIDESQGDKLRWKSRILQALTYVVDNELAGQASNNAQLDFFTAQLFLWLGKMMEYTSIRFKRDDIFKIETYDNKYPPTYSAELPEIWNALTGALIEEKLLKIIDGDEDVEFTYAWIVTAEQSPEGDDTPPVNVNGGGTPGSSEPDYTEEEEAEVSDDLLKQSLFLTDFAELERYVRDLYLELEPDAKNANLSFRQLIDKLSDMSVLTKTWRNSSNIKQLNDTRNKIAHGQAIGLSDLDQVRSSSMNIGRLRAEINDSYAYYVISTHLQDRFKIEKTTRGGFDFMATTDQYAIAFEVKSPQSGRLDSRTMKEIIDKFSNYLVINKQRLHYVLFYFQPAGRKSMDDFFLNFKKILADSPLENKKDLHLFYLTTSEGKSIRGQIEEALAALLVTLNKETEDLN